MGRDPGPTLAGFLSLDVAVSEGISQLRGHLPERLRLATHESDTADIGGKAKRCVVRLEFG